MIPPSEVTNNLSRYRGANRSLLASKYLVKIGDEDPWSKLVDVRFQDPTYEAAYRRWKNLWEPGGKRFCAELKVNGRLVCGLGARGTLDTGVSLHHTYGTPLIPASSVKGVLRRHLPPDETAERVLFGAPGEAGMIQWQDAWWNPFVDGGIELDVITPHHKEYQTGKAPPTDFDSPNPVHFLSFWGDFLFAGEGPAEWIDYLKQHLRHTLAHYGLGAKRTSGYGRFVV